jgi:hypothetical protein
LFWLGDEAIPAPAALTSFKALLTTISIALLDGLVLVSEENVDIKWQEEFQRPVTAMYHHG